MSASSSAFGEKPVQLLEEFVLADSASREKMVADWAKGTPLKQYMRLCYLLANGKVLGKEENELLEDWMKNRRYGEYLNVVLKFCYGQIQKENDSEKQKQLMQEFNEQFLKYTFNDERDTRGALQKQPEPVAVTPSKKSSKKQEAATGLKTALTKEDVFEMSTERLIKLIVEDKSFYDFDLGSADVTFLKKLDLYNMQTAARIRRVLDALPDFVYDKNIYKTLKWYKKLEKKNYKYFTLPTTFYDKITTQQADDLDSDSDFSEDQEFQILRFVKKHHLDLSIIFSPRETLQEKRASLQYLLKQSSKKGLKLAIHEALLINGYEQEIYDLDIFEYWLGSPLEYFHGYTEKTNKNVDYNSVHYRNYILYNPNVAKKPTLSEVIDEHVKVFIKDEKTLKRIEKYFNKGYFQKMVITMKALSGGDLKEYREYFGAEATDAFEKSQKLEFSGKTKRQFKKGEKAEVFVKVKNISKLVCKIFQVDTAHYYTTNNKEFDEKIDLDGLVAQNVMEFRYAMPKQREIEQGVVLDIVSAKDQGLFVVEFVGEALSCRMVIRKGVLQLMPFEHFAGIGFYIVDEDKNICKGDGTGVLIDGKFTAADDDGKILFPFSKELVSDKDVILVYKGFAFMSKLNLPREQYSLRSAVIVHEEGLVSDQINKIVIRNKLYLNSVPISLKRAQSTSTVTIETKNFADLTCHREFTCPLSDNEDIVLNYPIPKLLSHLTITVSMTVETTRKEKVVLKQSHEIQVNRNQGEDKFASVHLRRGGKDGKEFSLAVLGKNGEGVPAHRIEVEFLKIYGQYDYFHQLYTNEQGIATLGEIDDFKFIQVSCPQNLFAKRLFVLSSELAGMDIPSTIEMCVGEKLLLPALGKKINRENFEFFKVGQHPYMDAGQKEILLEDCFDQLKSEDTNVIVQNLTRGEYVFRYDSYSGYTVRVIVHAGTRWAGNAYILEKARSLTELKPESRYLAIDSVTRSQQQPNKVVIKFSSNNPDSVRAHALGYIFNPSLDSLVSEKLIDTCPQFKSRLTALPFVQNSLLGNRVLSDELKYCVTRQSRPAQIGNTLDKPSILLHRDKVRETKDEDDVLRDGRGFDDDKKLARVEKKFQYLSVAVQCSRVEHQSMLLEDKCDDMEMSRGRVELSKAYRVQRGGFFAQEKSGGKSTIGGIVDGITSLFKKEEVFTGVDWSSRRRYPIRSATIPDRMIIDNNMDYARQSGKIETNIKPGDNNNEIIVNLDAFAGCSLLQVHLSDINSSISIDLPITDINRLDRRDMRVETALAGGSIYTLDYSLLPAGKVDKNTWSVSAPNLSNAQCTIIDSMGVLMDRLITVSRDAQTRVSVGEFSWLASWEGMAVEDKHVHWGDHGGYELAIYCLVRDREYYREYIQPMLEYKAKKNYLDYLLCLVDKPLPEDFPNLPTAMDLSSLSPVEVFMLIYLNPASELSASLISTLKIKLSQQGNNAESFERKRAVFESILNKQAEGEALQAEENKKLNELITEGSEVDMKPKPKRSPSEADQSKSTSKRRALNMRESSLDGKKQQVNKEIGLIDAEMELSGKIAPELCTGGLIPVSEEEMNEVQVEEYVKAPPASEFKERQDFFKGQLTKMEFNNFWLNIYTNLVKDKGNPLSQDLEWLDNSEHALLMNNSAAEIIMALTFTRVPYKSGVVKQQEQTSRSFSMTSTAPFLVVVKSTKVDANSLPMELELAVSQKFYDPTDKFIYDDKDPSIFSIKEVKEFLTAKIYECRVGITNLSDNSYQTWLITQVPEGALPVSTLEDFKLQLISLGNMSTVFFTFKFYFPSVGSFSFYPATVMRNNRFVACARAKQDKLIAVEEYSPQNKPLETLQDMVTFGSSEDILRFASEKNIFNDRLFNFDKIRWVAKTNKESFIKLINLMKKNCYFDERLWAYSIYHGSIKEFNELFSVIASRFVQNCLYLDLGQGLVIETFEPLEYDPLVNPRAHEIQDKTLNIRNPDFRNTYMRFLSYCCEKVNLTVVDRVNLLGYLIMQERIPDSMKLLKTFGAGDQPPASLSVQFDYIRAYLSMFSDGPEYRLAQTLSDFYADFADLSWRERFLKIGDQLKEYRLGKAMDDPRAEPLALTQVKIQQNKVQAEKAEFLKIEQTGRAGISVTHRNIDRLTLKFFRYDSELLFSKDPFLENKGSTASITPNHEMKFRVQKSEDFKTNQIAIPEQFANENILVQINSKDKLEVLQVNNSSLHVHILNQYGVVQVADPDGKAITGCYVKSYRKLANGEVKFNKDGYTDMRGQFDYASLNTSSSDVKEYSLLVNHPSLGASTARATPPSTVGSVHLSANSPLLDFRPYYDLHFVQPDFVGELS
jgi:hypothetical protein